MTTELTLKQQVGDLQLSEKTGLQIQRVGEAWCFAELLARSGMLPKNTTVEAATVSMIAGARLGLDPFQAVQGIASVNGRPAIWGDAMVAVCKQSGLLEYIKKEVVKDANPDKCGIKVTVKRTDETEPYTEVFTVGDAKRAALWDKPGPWKQYPQRMLFNRARAFALRDAFADVLKGYRSVEEEQDTPPERDITSEVTVGAAKPAQKRGKPAKTIGDLALDIPAEAEVIEVQAAEAEAKPQTATEGAEVFDGEIPDGQE